MQETSQVNITPIFIIGASRNGTTSLVNLINQLPNVTKIEHELHHGSHEAKLYGFYKYYKELNSIDKYIDFLYHYSSEDYFQLAKGSIDFHLKNRRIDFFQFFFDMMDRCCEFNKNRFWVAKIDSSFFTDRSTLNYFIKLVKKRYPIVKYIKIQRDILSAVRSAQYMEGRNFRLRRKFPLKYYYLMAYTQIWFKTYLLDTGLIKKDEILHIAFDDFIDDTFAVKRRIVDYLGVTHEDNYHVFHKTYKINTSFTKRKPKIDLNIGEKQVVLSTLKLLKLFPSLVFFFHWINTLFNRMDRVPIYRKIIKYNYFRDDLKREFEHLGADGLMDAMNENE